MFEQFSSADKHENPPRDSNISSTYQTSVEVSIDDILNQTNENLQASLEEHKNIKDKNFRQLSESKKTRTGVLRHYRYTDIGKNTKPRPSSVEKYKTNSSLEGKQKKKLEINKDASFKSQFLDAGKLSLQQTKFKLKQFTPILSGKKIKASRLEGKETRSEAKVTTNDLKLENPSEAENLKQEKSEIVLLKDPKSALKSSEVFFSPLRNLKNFQNISKYQENPYANFEVSPNLTQILEDIQKSMSFDSDSESEKKVKIREPSFGLGGGEFLYEETQNAEETLYYEPSLEEEKTVQTEDREDIKSMLSLVTNKEFINSLKIIGKFASYLESNLV